MCKSPYQFKLLGLQKTFRAFWKKRADMQTRAGLIDLISQMRSVIAAEKRHFGTGYARGIPIPPRRRSRLILDSVRR